MFRCEEIWPLVQLRHNVDIGSQEHLKIITAVLYVSAWELSFFDINSMYMLFLVDLRYLDLIGESYTFGRGEMCDYQFSTDSTLTNPCYQAYSKVHFKVVKVICSLHDVILFCIKYTEWCRKMWTTVQSVIIIYLNCCSTVVSL